MSEVPIIEEELCIGCGACLAACPYEVFGLLDDDKAKVINPGACRKSGDCAKVCPTDAITLSWVS